ncbi:cytochrome P450 [Gigaspora rosea]|uniref:Cytochrome P450 n=1 Tax=Gigaspora rosea TaxID=44941 RepID=A0A397U7C2_9GLOM|nr:cytochrome P450 [Gigaspora rosea]
MLLFQVIGKFTINDYLIIISLTLLLYVFRFYYNHFTRPNPLPGPLPLPFELEYFFFDGNLKRLTENLSKKYGDICEFKWGGYRRILLSKTDYFENLLTPSTKSAMLFAKHEHTYATEELGLSGKGVFFNNNYETWKINKYLFTQAISSSGFNDEAIKQINKLFEELSGYWNSLRESSNNDWLEMDFLIWINRFTADLVSALATGERAYSMASYYNTFNSDNSSHFDISKLYHSDKFSKAIITQIRGQIFFVLVHPFLRRYVPILKDKANSLLANRDFIFGSLDDIIEKRKIDLVKNPELLKSKHDLLTTLLTANNDKKSKLPMSITDEDIRSILLDVFLGGSGTTSNLLSYIIYYICHNPHVKQKMFDEIDSVFPSDISHVTADIVAKLKYCEAIIKETSRMMPITAVSKRVAVAECEVAGYKWPAKTMFHLNYASIHKNEKYWENPDVFDPDRFFYLKKNDLDELENDLKMLNNESKKSMYNMDRYSLVIFGGGVRICPGRRLAMVNMISFMALMFRMYDVELVDMEAPLNLYTSFITTCLGLKIKIRPRKSL